MSTPPSAQPSPQPKRRKKRPADVVSFEDLIAAHKTERGPGQLPPEGVVLIGVDLELQRRMAERIGLGREVAAPKISAPNVGAHEIGAPAPGASPGDPLEKSGAPNLAAPNFGAPEIDAPALEAPPDDPVEKAGAPNFAAPKSGALEIGAPEPAAPPGNRREKSGAPDFAAPNFGAPEIGAPEPAAPPGGCVEKSGAPNFAAPNFGAPEIGVSEPVAPPGDLMEKSGAPNFAAPKFGAPEIGEPELAAPSNGREEKAGVPESAAPKFGAPDFGEPELDIGQLLRRGRTKSFTVHPISRIEDAFTPAERDLLRWLWDRGRPVPATERTRLVTGPDGEGARRLAVQAGLIYNTFKNLTRALSTKFALDIVKPERNLPAIYVIYDDSMILEHQRTAGFTGVVHKNGGGRELVNGGAQAAPRRPDLTVDELGRRLGAQKFGAPESGA